MNERAVEALREAMEPPTWWTNRARLSAREVLERLEAQGYRLAPVEEPAGASTQADQLPVAHDAIRGAGGLGRLMGELDTRVSDARRGAAEEVRSEDDEADRLSA